MKIKSLLPLVLCMLMSTSCSTLYYQVYEVASLDLNEENGKLEHQNEDLVVAYNFWKEGGQPGFTVTNNTENNIYIRLDESFYINNGRAFDYYKNREYSENHESYGSVEMGVGASLSRVEVAGGGFFAQPAIVNLNKKKSEGFSRSSGVSIKETPVVCIPPKASKYFSEYIISTHAFLFCDNKIDYPSKNDQVPVVFTEEDSPIVFQNRIAYSYDKSGNDVKYVENKFWVSEIINYKYKNILVNEEYKQCNMRKYRSYIKVQKSSCFYNRYRKSY